MDLVWEVLRCMYLRGDFWVLLCHQGHIFLPCKRPVPNKLLWLENEGCCWMLTLDSIFPCPCRSMEANEQTQFMWNQLEMGFPKSLLNVFLVSSELSCAFKLASLTAFQAIESISAWYPCWRVCKLHDRQPCHRSTMHLNPFLESSLIMNTAYEDNLLGSESVSSL